MTSSQSLSPFRYRKEVTHVGARVTQAWGGTNSPTFTCCLLLPRFPRLLRRDSSACVLGIGTTVFIGNAKHLAQSSVDRGTLAVIPQL